MKHHVKCEAQVEVTAEPTLRAARGHRYATEFFTLNMSSLIPSETRAVPEDSSAPALYLCPCVSGAGHS